MPQSITLIDPAEIKHAARLLRDGRLVAFPTETVYGLGANALDAEAVARIYAVKGRPATSPLIVHVDSIEMAKSLVAAWPDTADQLTEKFWPGPLTVVLPRTKEIPDIVTAGGPTVGVRWPSHPLIQAVIRECDFPLAAPSANLSGRISPTTAGHVRKQLGGKISLIIDGGQSQVGIESTVLDLTPLLRTDAGPPEILRPGMIHAESLAAVCGEVTSGKRQVTGKNSLRSPGLLQKHYSPKAKLFVLDWKDDADLLARLVTCHVSRATCHVIAHTKIPSAENFENVSVIPHDVEAFARAIYAELHRCDEAGAEWIAVEAPPDLPEWSAIVDRLRRAAR